MTKEEFVNDPGWDEVIVLLHKKLPGCGAPFNFLLGKCLKAGANVQQTRRELAYELFFKDFFTVLRTGLEPVSPGRQPSVLPIY